MVTETSPRLRGELGASRWAAAGGIVGPAAFVAAWVGVGASWPGYSPVHDAISRLAAVQAPDRNWMTAGFVVFGIAVPIYSTALRRMVPGRAWSTAAATGVATLCVAALPLDHSKTVDNLHALAAVTGYATLAATPMLAARGFGDVAGDGWRRWSWIAGGTSAALLTLSVAGVLPGFCQRAGLLAGDLWLAASAVWMLRGARD